MNTIKPVKVEICQIADASQIEINSFNRLLDEGVRWDEEQGRLFVQNNDNALFIASFDNQMVGFATAQRLQRFDKRKAEVLLYEVGVDEKYRRKGIGKALITTVNKWANSVGADEVWVLTNRSNKAAVALYTSCGGTEDALDTTMYTIAIK